MSHLKCTDVALGQGLRQANVGESTYEHCKRLIHDRRKLSIQSIWHSLFTGRRRILQRQTCDTSGYIIDTHESWLLLLTLGALLLSISDAVLTLVLLHHGATEMNPFMAILIESNISLFFWVKFTITAVALVALLIFKNFTLFKYFNGYHFIALTFLVYVCLIRYEFILLERI